MDAKWAIEIIQNGNWWNSLEIDHDPKGAEELHEALDMAISALEQQVKPPFATSQSTPQSVDSDCGQTQCGS